MTRRSGLVEIRLKLSQMAHEIDFLPVGDGERSGDAIALRYTDGHAYRIHVIDGGDQAAGRRMVQHIRDWYGAPSYIHAVICTHGDDDHSSGLREVINSFKVGGIWMNRPWLYADLIIDSFKDGRMTVASLERHLREEYPILEEIEGIATKREIPIHEAFQGAPVGAFEILAPTRSRYLNLIPEFSRTPEQSESHQSHQRAGSNPLLRAARSVRAVVAWVAEAWGIETLEEHVETSASNESSVVQLATLGSERILLTGDAGIISLSEAADYAKSRGYDLPGIDVIQVPHHGSRHNVSPASLNLWLGRPLPETGTKGTVAYVSVGKESKTHPRKKVVNAFIRRGSKVYSTKGTSVSHHRETPLRQGWGAAAALEFSKHVEA